MSSKKYPSSSEKKKKRNQSDAFIEKQREALDKFIRTNTSTSRNPDELALAIVPVELYEDHNISRNYWIKLILILSSPTLHLKMLEKTFEIIYIDYSILILCGTIYLYIIYLFIINEGPLV